MELEQKPEPARGVSPPILIEQVRNTAPFIFAESHSGEQKPEFRYLKILRETGNNPSRTLTHAEYYALCLSAHHATVGTFVPTDVDNQIRFKLWNPGLPTETLTDMAKIVLQSGEWDPSAVTTRIVLSPKTGEPLSGHKGEWFSTAAAAYCSLRKRAPETAAEVAGAIVREVQREAQILLDLKAAKNGLEALKASTLIAHNLGDLDRVLEMWNLSDQDALKQAVFKLGHDGPERFGGVMRVAGILNKSGMADENHRHFALRGPKCLRKSHDFLLPIGPFFDHWGNRISRHPGLSPKEIGEITEALVVGWEKLQSPSPLTGKTPVGYARALSGILEGVAGGFKALSRHIPAKTERLLKSGPLRIQIQTPQARFEEQWGQNGLKLLNSLLK